jgi:hypothetical protein
VSDDLRVGDIVHECGNEEAVCSCSERVKASDFVRDKEVPRISEKHLDALGRSIFGHQDCEKCVAIRPTLQELEAFLRAYVESGELSLVKTAEIEELIELSRHAGDVNFYTHKGVVRIVIKNLKRWLPTHPAQQNAPLSETTFMRHDNPACGDPTCMTCRGTRAAHPAQSDTETRR